MVQCIDDISSWTSCNSPKLNPQKTDLMWSSTNGMRHHLDATPLHVGGVSINAQTSVHLLGVTLDSDLSMCTHVSGVVSQCFYQLRRLKSIRRSLIIEATKVLVSALVLSPCDYHNGLLVGVSVKQLGRLQRILNAAARLIYGGSSPQHITPLLRDRLHWLRVKERITYKFV